jgi:hypothetical protein
LQKKGILSSEEFATKKSRERLIEIAARVTEPIARIRVQLPTGCREGASALVVPFAERRA